MKKAVNLKDWGKKDLEPFFERRCAFFKYLSAFFLIIIAILINSSLVCTRKAMSWSVARLVHFGKTVAGLVRVCVSVMLKGHSLIEMCTCTL